MVAEGTLVTLLLGAISALVSAVTGLAIYINRTQNATIKELKETNTTVLIVVAEGVKESNRVLAGIAEVLAVLATHQGAQVPPRRPRQT